MSTWKVCLSCSPLCGVLRQSCTGLSKHQLVHRHIDVDVVLRQDLGLVVLLPVLLYPTSRRASGDSCQRATCWRMHRKFWLYRSWRRPQWCRAASCRGRPPTASHRSSAQLWSEIPCWTLQPRHSASALQQRYSPHLTPSPKSQRRCRQRIHLDPSKASSGIQPT